MFDFVLCHNREKMAQKLQSVINTILMLRISCVSASSDILGKTLRTVLEFSKSFAFLDVKSALKFDSLSESIVMFFRKKIANHNPGRNNGRNFPGIRALTAVKNSHRSRY